MFALVSCRDAPVKRTSQPDRYELDKILSHSPTDAQPDSEIGTRTHARYKQSCARSNAELTNQLSAPVTESTFIERKSYNYSANTQSPREIKSREVEVELGSHSWMDCLAAELFLKTCFLGHCPRVCSQQLLERAISGVHKLLRIGGVPTSLRI